MQYATLFNHSEGDSCNHAKYLSSTQNSLKITQDLALIIINSVGWLAAKWAACCLECDCPGLPPCNWFGLRNSRSCAAIFSFSHSEVSLSTKASTTSSGVRYDKCLLMLAVAASTITGWFGDTLAGRSKKERSMWSAAVLRYALTKYRPYRSTTNSAGLWYLTPELLMLAMVNKDTSEWEREKMVALLLEFPMSN